jgi:hypothetical protein
MKHYVTMIDRFMSGWGMAEGKINLLIIECETEKDAKTIYRNAKKRSEMESVLMRSELHYFNEDTWKDKYYISRKHFDDLGDVWKG